MYLFQCTLKEITNTLLENHMPKTKKNFTRVTQLRMTEAMYDELTELAAEDGRPMANLIRVFLDDAIYYRKIGMSKRMAKLFLSKLGIDDPS